MDGPGFPLSQVKAKCDAWDVMFTQHFGLGGPSNILKWDRLSPENRRKLLAIWEEGIDNITRYKLGGPEA